MRWLYDAVYSGDLIAGSWPTKPVTNEDLFLAYCLWCDANHERKTSKIDFGRRVTKFLRGKKASGHGVRAGKVRMPDEIKKALPPLEIAELEPVEYLWSTGEWSSGLLDTSSEDE
jgi:hypothetical protein